MFGIFFALSTSQFDDSACCPSDVQHWRMGMCIMESTKVKKKKYM